MDGDAGDKPLKALSDLGFGAGDAPSASGVTGVGLRLQPPQRGGHLWALLEAILATPSFSSRPHPSDTSASRGAKAGAGPGRSAAPLKSLPPYDIKGWVARPAWLSGRAST